MFSVMNFRLLIVVLLCAASSIFAQQIEISGTIISSEDDFQIIGATILIKGKN